MLAFSDTIDFQYAPTDKEEPALSPPELWPLWLLSLLPTRLILEERLVSSSSWLGQVFNGKELRLCRLDFEEGELVV